MINTFKLWVLNDWFSDHDYNPFNPNGSMSDRWKRRGKTSLYGDKIDWDKDIIGTFVPDYAKEEKYIPDPGIMPPFNPMP